MTDQPPASCLGCGGRPEGPFICSECGAFGPGAKRAAQERGDHQHRVALQAMADREAARAEVEWLREANRKLHRRVQQDEAMPAKVARLEHQIATTPVGRSQWVDRFHKAERERDAATARAIAAEQRAERADGELAAVREAASHAIDTYNSTVPCSLDDAMDALAARLGGTGG